MTNIYKATYSPEDNKLRIYAHERLDENLYQRFIACGFKYAPIQKLFVAPWRVSREDFCLEFVDKIDADDISIAERAEAKVIRLEERAEKRFFESNSFAAAAASMIDRMNGQPILANHHSSSKSEKAKSKLERAEEKSIHLLSSANYWLYRATGVEKHANSRHNPLTRMNRIQTLLKDLRDVQRDINHGYICLRLWSKLDDIEDKEKKEKLVKYYARSHLATGDTCSYETIGSPLYHDKISFENAIQFAKEEALKVINSKTNLRIIVHTLNRLTYERYELGVCSRFTGKLTATIIKAFARSNGVHKPQAKRVDGVWELSSSVPLPLHLNPHNVEWLNIEDEDWVELMFDSGYEVPLDKPKSPPILNFSATSIKVEMHNKVKEFRQVNMTKSEYAKIYSDDKATRFSQDKNFRIRICRDPFSTAQYFSKDWVWVFITDQKAHEAPILDSVNYKTENEVAA